MNMYRRSPLKELKNFPASLGQADLSCPVQSAKVIINTAPPKLLFETPGVGYGGRGEAIASSAPKTPLKSSGQRSKPGQDTKYSHLWLLFISRSGFSAR